jgi:LysM repeat protein
MGLPPLKGGEPPVVTITGYGIPHPGPSNWVIENLQWGTNVIIDHNADGSVVRLRQDCVVNLMEYIAGDRVAFSRIPPATAGSPNGFQKPYLVKKGDTLKIIANKVYKTPRPSDWKLIAKANGIRDPKAIKNYVGKKIKIPKK